MKRGLRVLFCVLCSLFVALSPVSVTFVSAASNNECLALGVHYYECVAKDCDGNRSCDSTKADSVAFIGDSIGADVTTKGLLISGIEGLTEEYYDSVNSRPWDTGLDILRNQMLSRNIIVYELGTNNGANFNEQNIKDVMDIVGNSKTVIFITNYASNSNYPWFEDHNTIFHNAESNYNNVQVVDWAETAKQNGFALDDPSVAGRNGLGVHPYTQEEREAFANLIIDKVNSGVCRSGPIELLGDTAEEMIWSGLLSAGFTKEQAAGIMGSMEGESGYNPARHETALHDRYWKEDGSFKLDENSKISYGLGLIQWSFSRRINLYNNIKDKAPDLLKYLDDPANYGYQILGDEFLQKAGEDGKALLSYELAFLYDEISSTSSYRGILSQTTVDDAAEFFVRHVEIPGDIEGAVRKRKVWANEKYELYKDRSDLEPSNYGSNNISAANGVVLADMELGGTNKDYNGDPIFTDDQLAKIAEYRPFYEQAVEGTSIPWEMLAVIHTRESNLSRVNPNSDGLFQFAGTGIYTAGAYVEDDEFVQQLEVMVTDHLVPKWQDGLNEEDQIKQIFFGYNGRATAYINQARDLGFTEEQALLGEGSPYVMNKADAKRDPNKAPLGTWGQIKRDYGPIEYPANQDHGAYVMYVALHGGGSSVSDGGCGGENINATGAAAINKKAVEFAWPLGDPHNSSSGLGGNYLVATDAYKDAATQYGSWYSNGGADCSYFVGTVVAASGVDPDFPKSGSSLQTEYLRSSDKWASVPNDGTDESVLKAGDIMIVPHVGNKCGHVRVVVDLGNGTLGTAEASLDSHSGELHSYIGLDAGMGRGLYEIYRLK